MRTSSRELWLALLAVLLITGVYLFMMAMLNSVPAASSFYGHAMGVLGFVLMLMTETLYSMRKRSRKARWGRMSAWLQFHIFTGLVGPYLVLLHSSWKFNGVAGVLTLMTVVIVVSGFIGRYIYTAVPRTLDGVEVESGELAAQIAALEAELEALQNPPRTILAEPALALSVPGETQADRGPSQPVIQPGASVREHARTYPAGSKVAQHDQAHQLKALLKRRALLERQVSSLANARKLLATWHTIHIPIGLALFTLAFVHIVAAVYYAYLIR